MLKVDDYSRLFDRDMSVMAVCSPLASLDISADVERAKTEMDQRRFSVLGIMSNGQVKHYIRRTELTEGTLAKSAQPIDEALLIADSTPISHALAKLVDRTEVFVMVADEVTHILTRSDVEKVPVRLWLFGYIALFEMYVAARFRNDDQWEQHLPPNRIEAAERIFKDLTKKKCELDLIDCLQFCDKFDLLIESGWITNRFGLGKNKSGKLKRRIEALRNAIAHASPNMIFHDLEEIEAFAMEESDTTQRRNFEAITLLRKMIVALEEDLAASPEAEKVPIVPDL